MSEILDHADLRSGARSYNRDRNQRAKWSMGPRTDFNSIVANSLNSAWSSSTDLEPDTSFSKKIIPERRWSEKNRDHKSHANISSKNRGSAQFDQEGAIGRISRKQDAIREVQAELRQSAIRERELSAALQAEDASLGIVYSFDASSSPSDQIGLDKLVDRAEQRFKNKETDKIVKAEYEILDGEGETVRGKAGKRTSPKVTPKESIGADDDDEYELV